MPQPSATHIRLWTRFPPEEVPRLGILFKTELIKPRGPWRTADQAEIATLGHLDWFNTSAAL